ncbi:MAG: DinB family protein [Acidobacteria bacterium]|nr:DinB family protein [Acidobacteriota bacterium]MCW5967435.1 DinB family protein [Blastocatellales bacterium]
MQRQLRIAPVISRVCGMVIFSALIWLVVQPPAASGLPLQDPKMTTEERAKLVKYLHDSQKQLLDAISGLSEAQWKFKPAPERWSVGEVAEHIYLAESLLFAQAEAAIAAKPNPEWAEKTKGKTELLERVMVQRVGRAQAPESIVPTGKLSRDELIAKFRDARANTLKFAETTELPLKEHTTDHPFPIFSTLNAYQWTIYIPLHNIRHNQQIDEVKAHPDFPKN